MTLHRALVAAAVVACLAAGPGDRPWPSDPGAGRWLVTFAHRSFDLDALRRTIAARGSADAVAAIVAGYEESARRDQQPFAAFVADLGGRVIAHYWIYNGCCVEIPAAALGAVRAHPAVRFVHEDGRADPCAPAAPLDRATDSANHAVDELWARGIRGEGVTVAIVDEGVDADMNGSGRPHATYFVDGDPGNRTGGGLSGSRLLALHQVGAQPAEDGGGHGTGVSGVVAGETWSPEPPADRGHAPRASLVGYSIADTANGGAYFSTFVAAWQRIAAERTRYNIVVANNSYGGSPDPTHPSQQALDSLIINADVLVVVAAGNSGASTGGSQSCANGLVAGAVETDTRIVSAVSSRGPLSGDPNRFYPDLCANGIGVRCPLRDDEAAGRYYAGCCTSFASPQVCGAAALYRSVRRTASALETKAAILASVEDVAAKNPNPPFNSRNAYGVGYLRDDRLIALAEGGGLLATVNLTTAGPTQRFSLPVAAGETYVAAVAWHRSQLASRIWSDVFLRVWQNGRVLATADTPRNLYEHLRFTAPATGTVDLEIHAGFLDVPSLEVALAAMPAGTEFRVGEAAAFGQGCAGSGARLDVAHVAPPADAGVFATSSRTEPFGLRRLRMQHVVRNDQMPGTLAIDGIAYRPDDRAAPELYFNTNYWMALTVDAGYSPNPPSALSPTFANNITGTPVRVLPTTVVRFPDPTGVAQSPAEFVLRIPFDRRFVWAAAGGNHLLLDITKSEHSLSGVAATRPIDAGFYLGREAATVTATDPTAAGGSVSPIAPVLALLGLGSPAPPLLAVHDRPSIGNSYRLTVADGPGSAIAAITVGGSDRQWGGLALPFDLGPLGAPGCAVLASLDLVLPLGLDARGRASLAIPLPAMRLLVGRPLFHQTSTVDPLANRLGLTQSNALRVVPGG